MQVYIMSGTFNRLTYDPPAYEYKVRQSVAPLKYRLFPMSNSRCDPCRMTDVGLLGRTGVSLTHQKPLVDVDSNLKNLQIKATDAPSELYQPQCACGNDVDSCRECSNNFHFRECSINRDWTRLSNPICVSGRELGINRFQPLCLNPQDPQRWEQQAEVGINYRMVAKDNHVPKIPQLLDQSALFPTGTKESRRNVSLCTPRF